ncbi:hypothetical protein FGF1_03780 [Flavobacteriaceae bacterium GF1]
MPYTKRKLKDHTRIYLEALGYDTEDPTQYFECELTGNRAVDVHHIIGRGKGGEDRIENLMALTRQKHIDYGDKVVLISTLLLEHKSFLDIKGVGYDQKWFDEKLRYYIGKS